MGISGKSGIYHSASVRLLNSATLVRSRAEQSVRGRTGKVSPTFAYNAIGFKRRYKYHPKSDGVIRDPRRF